MIDPPLTVPLPALKIIYVSFEMYKSRISSLWPFKTISGRKVRKSHTLTTLSAVEKRICLYGWMTTDLTNVEFVNGDDNSCTIEHDSRSQTMIDFEAEDTSRFSFEARDRIGDLCALGISAASYHEFLLN
jgi:hypothetical protein